MFYTHKKSGNTFWPACLNNDHTPKGEGQIIFHEENTVNINILMLSMSEVQIVFNKAVGFILQLGVFSKNT